MTDETQKTQEQIYNFMLIHRVLIPHVKKPELTIEISPKVL